jgi:hypothetical protein
VTARGPTTRHDKEYDMDQTEKGKKLAEHLGDTLFDAHRSAFVRGGELVVFGNNGYTQDEKGRARREVEAALAWAKERGLTATDFGTSADGYSWAVVFAGGKPDELADLALAAEDVLWRTWNEGDDSPLSKGYETFQRGEAMKAGEPAAPPDDDDDDDPTAA